MPIRREFEQIEIDTAVVKMLYNISADKKNISCKRAFRQFLLLTGNCVYKLTTLMHNTLWIKKLCFTA